jgi:hypothetical protein
MKKIILLLHLLLPAVFVLAQPPKLSESKFRINLPDYWRAGNKVWKTLPDKLTEICEELKGKDLCGDHCNPRYTVEFYMSAPVVDDYYPNHISSNPASERPTETWEFITYYSFQCYLLLYDNKTEKLLTKIVVVDTSEVWFVKNRATLLSYSPPPPSRMGLRSLPVNNQNPNSTLAYFPPPASQSGQTPYSYINNNKEKLAPQEKDLLFVADSKFRNL